jgi:hypothetical protein
MITGVMVFGLVIFVLSFFISRRTNVCEKGEIATYVALIAWGSLMFGLFISKFTA